MKLKTSKCLLIAAAATQLVLGIGCASSKKLGSNSDLENFPKGSTPEEIGKRVADRFVASPHPNFGRPTPPARISYPEVCAWYGALTFAKESGNKGLTEQLA